MIIFDNLEQISSRVVVIIFKDTPLGFRGIGNNGKIIGKGAEIEV